MRGVMLRSACVVFTALALLSGSPVRAIDTFDIDGDGTKDALTDGLLVLRHLFGFSGSTLIEGAIAGDATRSTASEVESYMQTNGVYLDVDEDGTTDALTDGLLLLRHLFGFSGQTLVEGAVSATASRASASEIGSYIDVGPIDTDGDGTGDMTDAFPLDATEFMDTDGDGVGDNSDAFVTDPLETVDTDGDGTGNNADLDDDNDSVLDTSDAFPLDATETVDTDMDGSGDNADTDDDGDGLSDALELAYGTKPLVSDSDSDGIDDSVDTYPLDSGRGVDATVMVGLITGYSKSDSRPLRIIVSSPDDDSVYIDVTPMETGIFRVSGLTEGQEYVVSVYQAGTQFSSQKITAANTGAKKVSYKSSVAQTSTSGLLAVSGTSLLGLEDDTFVFSWSEDVNRSGSEYSSYINAPLEVQIIGDTDVDVDSQAALDLLQRYGAVLSNEGVDWSPEYAYRLSETLKRIYQGELDAYYSSLGERLASQKTIWSLTDQELINDFELVTHDDGSKVFRISTSAMTYASPVLAIVEGKRGKFFSQRLFIAAVRALSNNGSDVTFISNILSSRFGVRIATDSYFDGLYTTLPVIEEDRYQTIWQPFKAEELIQIVYMFEEFPLGMLDISFPEESGGLRYLLRRKDGYLHPLYPEAAGVAWTNGGYIEFMEAAFSGGGLLGTQRLIIHEKAHFLWAYLIGSELKYEWLKKSGWYRPGEGDPDCDGWSADPGSWTPLNVATSDLTTIETLPLEHSLREGENAAIAIGGDTWASCTTTQFVSTYAAVKNPNEDMAESIAYFITNPDLLRSRALPKYEFIRDYVMQGAVYLVKIREDLTFEVFNLYPDYVYPGKIKSVDVEVVGAAYEDKQVTVTIGIHLADCEVESTQCLGSVALGRTRLYSPIAGNWRDEYFTPLDANGSSLQAQFTVPLHSPEGFWSAPTIETYDSVGNWRDEKRASGDYGWKLYVNNPGEDITAPVYRANSMDFQILQPGDSNASIDLLDTEQEMHFSWLMEDKSSIGTNGCSGYVTSEASRIAGADSPYSFFNYGEGEFVSILSDELNLYRCSVRIRVTQFFPSGSYFISQARWKDSAGNTDDTRFVQDHLDYEDPVYATLATTSEDVKGPVMLIDPCATDDEDEQCIRVTAVPSNPESPDGQTIVTISYWGYDQGPVENASGLKVVTFTLRNPQGQEFTYYHTDSNNEVVGKSPSRDRYFSCPELTSANLGSCDATTPVRYETQFILPKGSAPGIWGIPLVELEDKANNYASFSFEEILRFESE